MRMSDILSEDFKDLGKLSDEELEKGHKLVPGQEGNFTKVPGEIFHKAISRYAKFDQLRATSKGLKDLTIYGRSQYRDMQCFLGKNNTSGYAIKGGDELVSVFSTAQSSGKAIVLDAVTRGVNRLDCFANQNEQGEVSGPLYSLYRWAGFVIDRSLNMGDPDEPYSIINGVSYSVVNGSPQPSNSTVVVYMIRK